MSDKTKAIRDIWPGWDAEFFVSKLEAAGWKYDPPTPVLPVVSDDALRALYHNGQWPNSDNLRAAFKVMLRENLGSVEADGWSRSTCRSFYRLMTGEAWLT